MDISNELLTLRPVRGVAERFAGQRGLLGLLDHGEGQVDGWFSEGEVWTDRTDSIDWADDGKYLFASLRWSDDRGEFEQRVQDAYRALLALMRERGYPHALRYWNYLPDINAVTPDRDGSALERYRQFNAARQRAFVDADQTLLDGAPAACALGSKDAWTRIAVLAGRRAPVALENPRQVSAYRYPARYGARSPTFSRGALVRIAPDRELLLISGTASIVGHASVHIGDVRLQTAETLRNLQAIVDSANALGGARFELFALDLIVYVRHAQDRVAVREVMVERLGAASNAVVTVYTVNADVCRADLLVEIEAHGVALIPDEADQNR